MGAWRRTRRAEQDLIDIWLWIAADNPPAADRLLDRIDATCGRLADNPRMGPARPDIAPDARSFVVGRYLVLYRLVDDGIEIVRVLHGARDVPRVAGEGW
jgi:toxin ParE1/3/4